MGIRKVTSDHRIVSDAAAPTNSLLLITIGGTGSKTSEFAFVAGVAATLGYRVLSVDYPDKVISTVCQTEADPDCYDKYRAEIVFGRQGSPIVDVDFTNSIEHRIETLFAEVVSRDAEKWRDLAKPDGTLDWDKVVLTGHSQGAGHVAYLAKKFRVRRVVMTGGPHDKAHGFLASWVLEPGATPANRYFGFLHARDEYDPNLEAEVVRGLMASPSAESLSIDTEIPPGADQHIFVTDRPARDPHNSLTKSVFEKVWRTLLQ